MIRMLVSRSSSIVGYRPRGVVSAVLAVSLVGAACGSTSAEIDEATADVAESIVEGESTTTAAPTTTTETQPEDDDGSEAAPDDSAEQPAQADTGNLSHPALGGLRVAVPEDGRVFSEGDYVSILLPETSARLVVARVGGAITGDPIGSVDELVAISQALTGAEVMSTGDSLEVLGAELAVYSFTGAVFEGAPGLFPARPLGYGSNVFWLPGPVAELGLAAVEGGVLAVGITAADDDELAAARAPFADFVDSLELQTNSGEISPVPTVGVVATVGTQEPFVPADPVEGAAALAQPFAPVEPGRYQLVNAPLGPVVDLPPGWFVAPNFPGFVVLLQLPFVGPGHRDLIVLDNPNQASGVSLGPTPNGDPVALSSVDDLINSALPNLVVENVEESVVGGLPATRFDLRVDPVATCQAGSPCSFVIQSPNPEYSKFVTPGVVHRGWWVERADRDPFLVMAAAAENDAAWLDETAAPLVSSLELGATGAG